MMLRLPALLPFALALAGCSSTGSSDYPSLAIRDVERAQGQFEPVSSRAQIDVPPVPVDLTGGLPARLAALTAQAQAAHAEFLDSRPDAVRLAAAAEGSSPGSAAWAAAQVALADLESARSQAAIALGDLDILYISATVQAEERSAITVARDQVIALIAEEDEALARLRAQVP